jgi:hypothetical protein
MDPHFRGRVKACHKYSTPKEQWDRFPTGVIEVTLVLAFWRVLASANNLDCWRLFTTGCWLRLSFVRLQAFIKILLSLTFPSFL